MKLKTVNATRSKRAKRKADMQLLHISYLLREWQGVRFFMSGARQNTKFVAMRHFAALEIFSGEKRHYAEFSVFGRVILRKEAWIDSRLMRTFARLDRQGDMILD